MESKDNKKQLNNEIIKTNTTSPIGNQKITLPDMIENKWQPTSTGDVAHGSGGSCGEKEEKRCGRDVLQGVKWHTAVGADLGKRKKKVWGV